MLINAALYRALASHTWTNDGINTDVNTCSVCGQVTTSRDIVVSYEVQGLPMCPGEPNSDADGTAPAA